MDGTTRRRFTFALAAAAATGALPGGWRGTARAAAPLTRFQPAKSGSGSESIDHAAFTALLAAHVKPDGKGYNRVDYRSFKADAGALKAYCAALQGVAASKLSRAEAKAFWINLYNAATLDVVLDHYPVASIRRINLGGGGLFGSGPWSRAFLRVEGVDLSLDDIEHRIVRPLFKDEMTHYGLNCASYSCPNLMERAYSGADVDALLKANAAAYVNHPRGVAVADGRITASKIYSWYAEDFGDGTEPLKRHWESLASPDHAQAIEAASIGGYAYDWSLNDIAG